MAVQLTFGPLLRELRHLAGFSQEELAGRSGLSVRALSDLERERVLRPHASSLRALATALQLTEEQRVTFLATAHLARTSTLPRSGPAPASQLPADVADFIGRDDELAELRAAARRPVGGHATALLVVTGKPGVGKTTLAIHFGHLLAATAAIEPLYVNLGAGSGRPLSLSAALGQLLVSLGVPAAGLPATEQERTERYRSLLLGRRAFLLLDDAFDETQIRPILAASASCVVVVTSRNLLAGLTASHRLTLDVLPESGSVDLLGQILGAGQVDAAPAAAADLAALCGRLPLALRVAGNRLAVRPDWTLAQFVERLRHERHRLALLRAGDLSVRTAFSLSYQQLSDDARRLFRRLWLIPAADFGLAAAPALLGRPEPDSESALDELVAASLVETAGPSGRYRLHDLVRVFAGDCLAEDEDERQRDEAEARLLDWVTRSASAAGDVLDPNRGPTSPGQRAAAIGWLEAQQATVLGAARRAVALDRYDQVLSVADALPWYFDLRCQWEAWKELSETALEAAMRSDNLAQQAIHLNHLGLALSQLRRPAEALACHEQASDAARRTGDSTEEGLALDHIATAYRRLERYDKAVDCHLRALDLFHDGGYPRGEAMATNHLGGTLTLAGRHAEALTRHEQALRLFRRLGDRVGEAMALLGMGQALHEMDRIEAASALFEQAIPIFREMDDRWGEGCCLRGLGLAEAARRHYDRASRWLHEADAVFQTLGDVAERAETVRALAMIALAAGDMDALFGAAPSPA